MTIAVQMRAKGSLTIPAELRLKYGFDEGDVFTLVELGDGSFLVTPRVSLVPKLVAEMEALRTAAGVTLDDLLSGLPEVRRQLFEEQQRRYE